MEGMTERLKEARKEAGLTHQKLADKAGVCRRAVIHMEKRTVDTKISTFVAVCQALNADPSYILYGDGVQA